MGKQLMSRQEIVNAMLSPFKSAMNRSGIDEEQLIGKLKEELNAEERKVIKISGQVDKSTLDKGYRVVAESENETIIEYSVNNSAISQKARLDAHKLRGDYPAEKIENTGTVKVVVEYADDPWADNVVDEDDN